MIKSNQTTVNVSHCSCKSTLTGIIHSYETQTQLPCVPLGPHTEYGYSGAACLSSVSMLVILPTMPLLHPYLNFSHVTCYTVEMK